MNFILLKPCPPCCPNAPAGWQDVKVSDDFYSYSMSQKKVLLKTLLENIPLLSTTLQPLIDTLQSGTDLQPYSP